MSALLSLYFLSNVSHFVFEPFFFFFAYRIFILKNKSILCIENLFLLCGWCFLPNWILQSLSLFFFFWDILKQLYCYFLIYCSCLTWQLCSNLLALVILRDTLSILVFVVVAQLFSTLTPHGLQHARLPCPSPSPRAYSNSCRLSW